MGTFKNFLKKFMPPPVDAFNRELGFMRDFVQKENRALSAGQHEEIERVLEVLAQQQKQINIQQWQMESLSGKVQELERKTAALGPQIEGLRPEIEKLGPQIEKLDKFEALEKSLKETAATGRDQIIQNSKETNDKQLKSLQMVQQNIQNVIPNKPVLWTNVFERRVVEANWGDVSQMDDFADKFVRLTKGLDGRSIETIIRILLRQKTYLNSDAKQLDLFTRAEQEEIRLLRENFISEIIKLSDELYAYKNYLLPVNHFESSVFYYKHGIGDLNDPGAAKGKTVIDVGGFIGDSVLVLSELEPSSIYTFEAVPENYELLKKTLELNRVPNVTAENMALGAETGTMTIHVSGSGSTSIDRPGLDYKGDIEVPVTTLDDYVAEHDIKDIGLIKVDIEGGEPAFLEGAKKTICEQKPILLLSIYHNAHDFFELKPLVESWDLGYRFKIHRPTYGSTTGETLLLAEIGD